MSCLPADGKAVHPHSDGTWWFWDETWADELGPYPDRETAERRCQEYAAQL
jgi:hypothetical protein